MKQLLNSWIRKIKESFSSKLFLYKYLDRAYNESQKGGDYRFTIFIGEGNNVDIQILSRFVLVDFKIISSYKFGYVVFFSIAKEDIEAFNKFNKSDLIKNFNKLELNDDNHNYYLDCKDDKKLVLEEVENVLSIVRGYVKTTKVNFKMVP